MTHPDGGGGTGPVSDPPPSGPSRHDVIRADAHTSACDRAIADYLRNGVAVDSLDRNGERKAVSR